LPDVQETNLETFEVAYLDSDSFAMFTLGYLATHDVDADAASIYGFISLNPKPYNGLCMRLTSNSA
jgi:hypothetical protein